MNRFIVLIGVAAMLAWAGGAQAHVNSGGDCSGCHSPATGRATVTAPATTSSIDPATVPVGLPMFLAHPGDTISLPIKVTNGGSVGAAYAVVMSGLNSGTTIKGLVSGGDILTFTADTTWTPQGSGTSAYATKGPASWSGTATNYSYALTLGASVPADYYSVKLVAAGSSNGRWSQSQDVIIHVTPVPEPASLAALGLSGGLLLMRRRRLARAA